jgi:hypothetical protein
MTSKPKPLYQLILDAVACRGRSTPAQVLSMVSKYIPASRAVQAAQRCRRNDAARRPVKRPRPIPLDRQVARGKYLLVILTLMSLKQRGRVKRIRRGIYAPIRPKNLSKRLVQALLDHGECSTTRLIGFVGSSIPAAEAAAYARTQYKHDLKRHNIKAGGVHTAAWFVQNGRRVKVIAALKSLALRGKIRRVRRGVYGPPLPRLFRLKVS